MGMLACWADDAGSCPCRMAGFGSVVLAFVSAAILVVAVVDRVVIVGVVAEVFLSILGLPPLGQVRSVPACRARPTGEGGACGCLPEVLEILRLAPQALAPASAAPADVCSCEDGRGASAPRRG